MQNSYKELYWLLDLLVPGCAGSQHKIFESVRLCSLPHNRLHVPLHAGSKSALVQHYAKPMRQAQAKGATKKEMDIVGAHLLTFTRQLTSAIAACCVPRQEQTHER